MVYSSTSTARDEFATAAHYPRSAMSWAAVFAGTVIACALSITLLTGGIGLGFLTLSPNDGEGASITELGLWAIIWMFVVQILAYGVGGYVTGRLRPMWAPAYSDEIYFRDTAHGLAVWALSAIVSLVLFGTAVSAAFGTATKGIGALGQGIPTLTASAGAAALGMKENGGNSEASDTAAADYVVDQLFRDEQPDPFADPQLARAELARLVTVSAIRGEMREEDENYAAQVIALQTGMTQEEARQRQDHVLTEAEQARQQAIEVAKEAADAARQAAVTLALWSFAALLLGAFVASLMAMVGGRAARNPD